MVIDILIFKRIAISIYIKDSSLFILLYLYKTRKIKYALIDKKRYLLRDVNYIIID